MRRAVLLLLPALSACANMAGLDGKSEFACKAPDGVVCTSVSGVYANTLAGTLPARHAGTASPEAVRPVRERCRPETPGCRAQALRGQSARRHRAGRRHAPAVATQGTAPLARPWVDEDGDLHDQAYLYVMWHRGEWQLGPYRGRNPQPVRADCTHQRMYAPAAAAGARSPDPATLREGTRRDAREHGAGIDTATPSGRGR
jgi:conjugal transfer pilus assembly protein TraV